MMSTRPKPLPVVDDWNRPFWEAARAGKLCMQCCRGCGEFRFPPASVCAHCGALEFDWKSLSGSGSVVSYVVFHKAYFPGFADEVPYAVVLVKLTEGPQLYGNVLNVAPKDIHIGMRVETRFVKINDTVSLPQFVAWSAPTVSDGDHEG